MSYSHTGAYESSTRLPLHSMSNLNPSTDQLNFPPKVPASPSALTFNPSPAGYSASNRPRPSLGINTGPTSTAGAGAGSGASSGTERLANRAARKSSLPALPPTSPFLVPDSVSQGPSPLPSPSGSSMASEGRVAAAARSPLSPQTPGEEFANPLSPNQTHDARDKRANPLEDLIKTETFYVDDLGTIIKRVAAAWSRSNFPPPELDSMFRAIEAVYRINKSLLAKLVEIGPSPASPKALGDLLMRWISDLTPAYSRYAATFLTNFDQFEPVQANQKLGPILETVPYPRSLPRPSDLALLGVPVVREGSPSLDQLFMLPVCRLSYYKRLYGRLLRSTKEGRSDHQLLVSSNKAILALLDACEAGRQRSVVPEPQQFEPEFAPDLAPAELVVSPAEFETSATADLLDEAPRQEFDDERRMVDSPQEEPWQEQPQSRALSEAIGQLDLGDAPAQPIESAASSDRFSSATAPTSNATDSTTLPPRVEDLERRLNPDRALDIFTMRPKKCKLQIQPASLQFARQLRRSADAVLSFYPLSDPDRREVVIRRAHIFLLTDLFLVCERMSSEERAAAADDEGDGPDMWLVYPPLAGKHLYAHEVDGAVEVSIMRKEKLRLTFEGGQQAIQDWLVSFRETIEFGAAQPNIPARSGSVSSSTYHGRPDLQTALSPNVPSPAFTYGSSPTASMPSPLSPVSPDSHAIGYGPPPSNRQYPDHPEPRRNFTAPSGGTNTDEEVFVPPQRKQSMYFAKGPGSIRSMSASPQPGPQSPTWGQGEQPQPPRPLFAASRDLSNSSLRSQKSYGSLQQVTPTPNEYYTVPSPARPRADSFATSNGGYDSRGPSPSGYYVPPPPLSTHQLPPFAPGGGSMRGPGSHFDSQPPSPNPSYHQPNSFGPSYGGGGPSLPPLGTSSQPFSPDFNTSGSMRSSGSTHSISGRTDRSSAYPDMPPPLPGKYSHGPGSGLIPPMPPSTAMARSASADAQYSLPSQRHNELNRSGAQSAPGSAYDSRSRAGSSIYAGDGEYESPPSSPTASSQPDVTTVVATMRCKVFLQQNHAQWKSLGTAKLRVYLGKPSMTKQLVVESDKSDKKMLVSTIVLTDGVERVGKTGVAIELSDRGSRTGIVYMLQMKTEQSATGLFDQLLLGSDRRR